MTRQQMLDAVVAAKVDAGEPQGTTRREMAVRLNDLLRVVGVLALRRGVPVLGTCGDGTFRRKRTG